MIAISKETIIKAMLSDSLPDILNRADKHCTDVDNAQYWVFESVKWYDTYTDVIACADFMNNLDEDDYGFIRIGEELDDIETSGNPWEYDMYVQTSINSPVEDF